MACYGLGFCRKERERGEENTHCIIFKDAANLIKTIRITLPAAAAAAAAADTLTKKYVGNFPMTRGPSWPNES